MREVEKNDAISALESLKGVVSPRSLGAAEIVFETINAAVELCFRTRRKVGKFLFASVEAKALSAREIRRGLTRFAALADDLEVDVPRLRFNLAQICAPLIADDRVFPFSYLEEICKRMPPPAADRRGEKKGRVQSTGSGDFFYEIMKEAAETLGKEKVLNYWELSEYARRKVPEGTLMGFMT